MAARNFNYIPLFLLSIALFCIADIVSSHQDRYNTNELARRTNHHSRRSVSSPTSGSSSTTEDDPLQDSELLDVVLVASVDGKFHALNRTSGHLLWSMPSFAHGQGPGPTLDFENLTAAYPSTLAPLVRTVHNQKSEWTIDGDEPSSDDEVYIIEPQSGAIYILPSNPSTQNLPLRKFPFTMPELVNMSPFSFADSDGQSRLFVGSKETSMLVVELETGKIKASVGGECRWDPFDDLKEEAVEDNLDLDDLESEEEEKPPKAKFEPTEVFIGRTDYHITISTLSRKASGNRAQPPPVQNLSFSTYGPNNQDKLLQSSYLRTKDSSYIQSLPSGGLMGFRAHTSPEGSPDPRALLWLRHFPNPIVATFDVLRRPAPAFHPGQIPDSHTFVLLQPQPSLTDFHPSLSHANVPGISAALPNSDSAYVGLVEETGSLFAMSPERFPFFAFGNSEQSEYGGSISPSTIIDMPEGGFVNVDPGSVSNVDANVETNLADATDLPANLDEVTRLRKLREEKDREQKALIERSKDQDLDTCGSPSSVFDLRCLVGMRKRTYEEDDTTFDQYVKFEGKKVEIYDPIKKLDAPPRPSFSDLPPFVWEDHSGPRMPENFEEGPPLTDSSEEIDLDSLSADASVWKWEILVTLLIGLVGVVGVAAGRYTSASKMPLGTSVQNDLTQSAHSSSGVIPLSSTPANVGSNSSVEPEVVADLPAVLATPTLLPGDLLSEAGPPSPSPANVVLPIALPSAEPIFLEAEESDGDVDEAEGPENDAAEPGGRKKKMRRKRGKKKKGGFVPSLLEAATNPANGIAEDRLFFFSPLTSAVPPMQTPLSPWPPAPSLAVIPATPVPVTPTSVQQIAPPPSTLLISDTVLGFGSHGTVVFRGSLQGRSVAVKRLLRDFVTLASREVSILQESDDHPNVIRYYYQETHANFLYIALELCPGSLADVFETSGDLNMAFTGLDPVEESRSKEEWREIRESIINDPKKAIRQITSGMRHLHALKLVHRDIKPQNILVAAGPGRGFASSSTTLLSRSQNRSSRGSSYRMLISDFGLCKKLDLDQTSFLPTAQGAMGAGTFGWRAPEILRGEVKLDNSEDTSSSKGSSGTVQGNASSIGSTSSSTSGKDKPTRLTKSVDIFALGCLFYYMLTAGGHPFGDRFEREVNIIKGTKDISGLQERYGEEGVDAADLIEAMLNADSSRRPDTSTCLLHPFFWDSGRRLNFLQDASDRFEIMCRDPKDAHLLELEKDALQIVGHDWHSRVDKVFIDNLGKFRKYDGKSVQDLLRALRNKKHHYQDLPENVKRHLGAMPEGYLSYFTRRYPQLFLHVHRVINDSELRSEPMFKTYFELAD